MYIIVTDYNKIPKKYAKQEYKIISVAEFIINASNDDGVEFDVNDELLIDFSSLSKDMYNSLQMYRDFPDIKITFYTILFKPLSLNFLKKNNIKIFIDKFNCKQI